MPTLNKLEYLYETKQQIKNALNTNFNSQIQDTDTFRSYVSKINDIYTNWAKVTGEDTTLSLTPTKKGLMKVELKGNTSQDGTPTPDTPIPIKVVTGEQNINIQNKNLLPGKIFEHCTITNTGEKAIDNSRACSDFIKVISNDNYYLSYGVINGFTGIVFYDEKYNYISRIIWSNEISHIITIPNNIEYVKIFLQKNIPLIATENQFADDKVQFVKSNVATDYVEHQEQTYPLSLGNIELARIGNYKDYIFKNVVGSHYYNADLDLNEWYLHKEIEKITLSNSDSFTLDSYSLRFTKVLDTIYKQGGYSNRYIYGGTYQTTGKFEILNNGRLAFSYPDSNIDTVTELQTYLTTNELYMYLSLSTPTNTKITDTTLITQLENINNNSRSYKDTTIIECTSESTDNEVIVANVSALMKGV